MKIIIFCLIAIVFSQAQASEAPTLKSGWKELKNKHGWSVQFPKDFIYGMGFTDEKARQVYGPLQIIPPGEGDIYDRCVISFSNHLFRKSEQSETPREYVLSIAKFNHKGENSSASFLDDRDFKLDGYTAYDVVIKGIRPNSDGYHQQDDVTRWVVAKKGGIMLIDLIYPKFIQSKKCDQLFDEILKTFRFTDGYQEALHNT